MAKKSIVIFFSYGISLKDWQRLGLLDRQRFLIDAFAQVFERVVLITYGSREDLRVPLPGACDVCVKPRWCPRPLYALVAGLIHFRSIRKAAVSYTFQVSGALPAFMSRLYGIPLVVHCGYPWSVFSKRQRQPFVWMVARLTEWIAGRLSEAVIATANFDLSARRLVIIPNGIDLERFCPGQAPYPGLICWSGRMIPQKCLELLLRAVAGLEGVTLRLIGAGPQRNSLKRLAHRLGVAVEWVDPLPNDAVAQQLQQASLFVFPSVYEGDPKALLEAMACGLPVIASDIPAHQEIIQPGLTGLLCPLDAAALRRAIAQLLADEPLRRRLGTGARAWMERHRDVRQLVKQEYELLRRVSGGEPLSLIERHSKVSSTEVVTHV